MIRPQIENFDGVDKIDPEICGIVARNWFVGEVHDRMPVLLAEREFEPWLSGAAGVELLKGTG